MDFLNNKLSETLFEMNHMSGFSRVKRWFEIQGQTKVDDFFAWKIARISTTFCLSAFIRQCGISTKMLFKIWPVSFIADKFNYELACEAPVAMMNWNGIVKTLLFVIKSRRFHIALMLNGNGFRWFCIKRCTLPGYLKSKKLVVRCSPFSVERPPSLPTHWLYMIKFGWSLLGAASRCNMSSSPSYHPMLPNTWSRGCFLRPWTFTPPCGLILLFFCFSSSDLGIWLL